MALGLCIACLGHSVFADQPCIVAQPVFSIDCSHASAQKGVLHAHNELIFDVPEKDLDEVRGL